MTSTRDQVIAALEAGDQLSIRRLGWWPVWEALATWWAPRQTATAHDMVPFAKVLGDEDSTKIVDALRDLAGPWRPHPAAIRGHIHQHSADNTRVDPGRATDPATDPAALAAARTALANGEPTCQCGCPTARTWRRDPLGVWRCPTCRGLEQGQAWSAEDLTTQKDTAA